MRKYIQLAAILLAFLYLGACSDTEGKEEKASPAASVNMRISKTDIAINYNSPRVKGRKVWGGLVPYGQVWRTGADEATVFSTNTEISIDSLTLPAGKYALFTIPGEKEWTIILNKEFDQWGAFNYSELKDAIRFTVKPLQTENNAEGLAFSLLEVAENEGEVKLAWEKTMVSFSFKVPQAPVK